MAARSTGTYPAPVIRAATAVMAASSSPAIHWTTRSGSARVAAAAWKAAVSVLKDFVYRAPGIRSALTRAAVRPPRSSTPARPNWLVVSMTIRPSSGPAARSASSMSPQGTDSTTTSAAAASDGSPTAPPTSAARAASLAWSLAKLTTTWCPASASLRAMFPPMLPAPMMPTRVNGSTSQDDIGLAVAPAQVGCGGWRTRWLANSAGPEQGERGRLAEQRVGERQQVPVPGRQLSPQPGGRPGDGGRLGDRQAEPLQRARVVARPRPAGRHAPPLGHLVLLIEGH